MALSGDAFHRAILSGKKEFRRDVLLLFKTHVKKDNVELASVPRYFEALAVSMNLLDPELQLLAFSLVCHLVKRVSIQDKIGTILSDVSAVVLPLVVPKIADARSSVKMSARRALEAYWLSSPRKTERAVAEIGLKNGSLLLANESVVWLNTLLLINANLDLHAFFEPLARVLARSPEDAMLISNVKILFANYFDLKHNRLHRFELQKVLEALNVDAALRTSIIGTDSLLLREYESKRELPRVPVKPVLTSSTLPERTEGKKIQVLPEKKFVSQTPNEPIKPAPEANTDLDVLLSSLVGYSLEDNVEPLNIENEEELNGTFASCMPCFEGKETEKNWIAREKSISTLRAVFRGNSRTLFPDALQLNLKQSADAICKGLMSLRTSLCLNACQFVKELVMFLKQDFGALLDLFWPTLLKLCSNTKHLTSSNAHIVISAIYANTFLSNKLAQKIQLSAREKSANVRAYSAFWLQIYMIRSHKTWPVPPSCEIIESVLFKLLPDPNVQVRLAAKDAFWRYYVFAVDAASNLLSRLDSNTIKALERSRPKHCGQTPSMVPPRKSRPSIKEAIMAKNKELRGRQSISRSSSRNGHTPLFNTPNQSTDDISQHVSQLQDERSSSRATSDFLRFQGVYNRQNGHEHDLKLSIQPSRDSSSLTSQNGNLRQLFSLQMMALAVSQPNLDSRASVPETAYGHLAQKEPEHVNLDTIKTLLSSKGFKQIQSGVDQLKSVLLTQMLLPNDLKAQILSVSVSHPQCFEKLLSTKLEAAGLADILGPEEFVRTCFVTTTNRDECWLLISGILKSDEILGSINSLLINICDMDAIRSNKTLVMQLIKSKSLILATLMHCLLRIMDSRLTEPHSLTAIVSTLLNLVPIVYQTDIIDSYKELLKNVYESNEADFMAQLNKTTQQNRSAIKSLLGLETEYKSAFEDASALNPSEFTLIAPGMSNSLSPLKHPSDFTMLFPAKAPTSSSLAPSSHSILMGSLNEHQGNNHKIDDIEPSNGKSKNQFRNDFVNVQNEEQVEPEHFDRTTSVPSLPHPTTHQRSFQNIFAKSDSQGLKSDFVAKLNSDPAKDLVDDFAQVKLSNFSNSIESFIEKVDPLNCMSTKSRPIQIYEDPKGGSPQKAKDYKYTDLNWFNFLIARLSMTNDSTDESGLDSICQDLSKGCITSGQLAQILKNLQDAQFDDAARSSQFLEVEDSLWLYLSFGTSDKLTALMIVKQLLVCRHSMNLPRVWSALLEIILPKHLEKMNLIELALSEVFEEMMCGLYPSLDLFAVIFETLESRSQIQEELLYFLVDSLHRLLKSKTLLLIINHELILAMDGALHQYLAHESSRIRKMVYKTYGAFVKASAMLAKSTETISVDHSDTYHSMTSVIQGLSSSERSLVEFYGKDDVSPRV